MAQEDCGSPFDPDPEGLDERFRAPENVRLTPATAKHFRGGVRKPMDEIMSAVATQENDIGVAKLRAQRAKIEKDVPLGVWSRYFQPFGHVFHKIEAAAPDLKVHTYFREIEKARTAVDTMIAPHIQAVSEMARKLPGVIRGGRANIDESVMQVQLLMEARALRNVGGRFPAKTVEAVRKMEADVHPNIVKVTDLAEAQYVKLMGGLGYTKREIDLWFANFPVLRKNGGVMTDLMTEYTRVKTENTPPRLPTTLNPENRRTVESSLMDRKEAEILAGGGRLGRDMYDAIKTGELIIDDREYNFAVIFGIIARKQGEMKLLAPVWNQSTDYMTELVKQNLMPPDVYDMWMKYTSSARHIPDATQAAIARTFQSINKAVFKMSGERLGKGHDDQYLDLAGRFLSVNYVANMGFNPGVALRNYGQPFITSYPIIGNDLWEGIKVVMSPHKKINWHGKMTTYGDISEQIGIIARTSTPQQLKQAETAMSALGAKGPALTSFSRTWEAYQNGAWAMFRSAETHTRMSAYWGMRHKALREGRKFMASNRSAKAREAFMRGSALELMVPENSPMTKMYFDWFAQEGDKAAEMVAHSMALEHVAQSMFIYTAGNSPGALQTTVGRMLGQYGTWPSWFAAHYGRMLRYGSKSGRLKALGRATFMNGALGVGVAEVFGADVSNWIYLSPLSYDGGPFLQGAGDVNAAIKVGLGEVGILDEERDPVQLIRAERAKDMLNQVTPWPRQFGNIADYGGTEDNPWPGGKLYEDAKRFQEESFNEASLRILGFPAVPEGEKPLERINQFVSPLMNRR